MRKNYFEHDEGMPPSILGTVLLFVGNGHEQPTRQKDERGLFEKFLRIRPSTAFGIILNHQNDSRENHDIRDIPRGPGKDYIVGYAAIDKAVKNIARAAQGNEEKRPKFAIGHFISSKFMAQGEHRQSDIGAGGKNGRNQRRKQGKDQALILEEFVF